MVAPPNSKPDPNHRTRAETAAGTKALGDAGELRAEAYLVDQGLTVVERNFRVARGPHSHGGEVDLICRDGSATLVFVEVRARRSAGFGGAAASIGRTKQQRLVFAARHYLRRFAQPPACRFDVLSIEGDRIEWLRAAFDAG